MDSPSTDLRSKIRQAFEKHRLMVRGSQLKAKEMIEAGASFEEVADVMLDTMDRGHKMLLRACLTEADSLEGDSRDNRTPGPSP